MKIHLTVDEIVELLKRSSITSVIVEGKDDMTIYRWLEERIGIDKANFFPCGGRDTLLKVFNRRDEFSQIKTIFLADKDCFVYSGVPKVYEEILWTKGYSIENDLYYGRFLEKILTVSEEVNFKLSLKNFIQYYAFEVEQFNKKLVYNFSNHPNQVLDDNGELNTNFLSKIYFINPTIETVEYLSSEYELLIRGKSLFSLLLRFLSHTNREVKHNKKSLCETSFKLTTNSLLDDLTTKIQSRLYA